MKKDYNDKFAAIIESICFWLGYQHKIGRAQLMHEASLRYPIADTITSKGISINRIELEFLHPYFMSKKIDLVIVDEKEKNEIQEVYEFKLAKYETSKEYKDEHQRVFDDVVRLAYFNEISGKDCYFLMCGKYADFKNFFVGQKENVITKNQNKIVVSQQKVKSPEFSNTQLPIFEDDWKSNGLYSKWFAFNIEGEQKVTFNITNPKSKNEWGLRNFQQNYKKRNGLKFSFENSISIKTTCLAITPKNIAKNRTHAAGIWKIESIKKN